MKTIDLNDLVHVTGGATKAGFVRLRPAGTFTVKTYAAPPKHAPGGLGIYR